MNQLDEDKIQKNNIDKIIKLMDKESSQNLPTYSFYRRKCHSSHRNFLCYLSSTTEIRVIRFDGNGSIAEASELKIPQEPVKGVRIFVESNEVYYVGVALISRFIVFKNKEKIYEGNLSLDCNISEFAKGFCGVEVLMNEPAVFEDGRSFYFLFLTKNGDIIIFDPKEKNKILKTPRKYPDESYEAFTLLKQHGYLSTNNGCVVGIKIIIQNQHYEEIGRYNSNSGLPLLELVVCQEKEEVFCGTAHGEIHILSKDVSKSSIVSAHHCLICRMLVSGGVLYTIGEDCMMHKFDIKGDRKLSIVKTEVFKRLPSLLFKMPSGNYLTFYENPKIVQI